MHTMHYECIARATYTAIDVSKLTRWSTAMIAHMSDSHIPIVASRARGESTLQSLIRPAVHAYTSESLILS